MKLFQSDDTLARCIKYVTGPITLGIVMYKLFSHYSNRKKRRALEGKVVVITGASSGIGEALAHAFYEQGSTVVLAARRKTELERVKQDLILKQLPLPTQDPIIIELDLGKINTLDTFAQKVYDQCGEIDILINNGGISHRGSILHTTLDVYQQVMNINCFGAVALTKAILPRMVKRKCGHIAFVSSVQGLIAIPDRSAYATTKHAIQAYADCLRAEMHQYNINVTVISPGYVKTNISINALTGSGDQHGVMDKATAEGFTPEYTAHRILDAIVNKKNELVISQLLISMAIFVRHFSPSLYFWIMQRRANRTAIPEVNS